MAQARDSQGIPPSERPLSGTLSLKATLFVNRVTIVFPVERLLRDVRLITIWTGTNEIMNLVIQHEFYREFLSTPPQGRDIEADAADADATAEKVYR